MLGHYGLGANILDTITSTQRTVDEMLPTINKAAEQYEKAAPGIDFAIDYWYTVLAVVALCGMGGAAIGSYLVLKRLEK